MAYQLLQARLTHYPTICLEREILASLRFNLSKDDSHAKLPLSKRYFARSAGLAQAAC